jgi:uroporphyrin-3 C-methyltransferase
MSDKPQNESELENDEAVAEAEIIDAEVIEPEAPAAEKASSGGSGLPLILALVAIAGVIALLGFGYQYWNGLKDSLAQMNSAVVQANAQQDELKGQLASARQELERQQKEFDAQRKALAEQDSRLAAEREKLKQQGSDMEKTLKEVYSRVGRNSNQWMASEAEYLMRVANHRLLLEGDSVTAIKALEAADGRLRDTGDPGWIGVRELIASEIAALKGLGQLDRAGLSARLASMAEQVKGLKMEGLRPMAPETGGKQPDSARDERSLDTLLRDGWEGFKSVMVIRHRDKPVSAMLSPEQQFFVYQNLELQFEAARLALLRRDPLLYTSSLKTAAQWLGDFFDTQATAARALLDQIGEMQQVDVNPVYPDISKSLASLRERQKMQAGEGAQ